MDKHPIQSIMSTTMENLKDMVDVNTVVGDPVETNDGTTIIPISRVSFGFVAGGGEYGASPNNGLYADTGASASRLPSSGDDMPFAGGTGAGVSVHPMGFLVVGQGQIKMLPTNYATPVDRVMELLPQVLGEIKDVMRDDSSTSQSTAHTIPVETNVPHPTITEHVVNASVTDNKYEHRHASNDKKFSSYSDNKDAYNHNKAPLHDSNK